MIAQLAVAGKRHNNPVHMLKKSVIHVIGLLLSVSHWPIIMIGPGGLLLVVPNLFAVPGSG
jgi:hypothetical protein